MSVAVDSVARVLGLVKGPLQGVDLEVPGGQLTAVVGLPGSGKSTLVSCVGGLSRPAHGSVYIGQQQLHRLGDAALTRVRRDRIGYVFATSSLLPLSVAQNILIGHELAGRRPDRGWFDTVVRLLELRHLLKTRPETLTTLERQRVACARAFMNRPDVVLADEPTGELDQRDAGELLGFLRMWVRKLDQSILMVTSEPRVAAHADQVFLLRAGRIEGRIERPTVGTVSAALERS
ncbi:ABC transporter ATP-binding protein [Actinocrispum wychmicini]|uniref:Putative ABC transport system ATP-binding protein n=1 Tax=Actinocrispum wychmicini TaxID=1213861 RepID=A0A4R2JAT2_9PSEU|nr:ATP-binding cassette domain-containing protein [Actinocrispum wychmicini]TCO56561.1 putative ABC transport system ATP-binding protein [Actinocrispum wychmicini]